jgi:hypothetical protein
MGALRNTKHERFALLRAMLVPRQKAAREAGIETDYPGNIARIDRRKDVRRRIEELTAESRSLVREKRDRIEARLNASAYGDILEFALVDQETKQIIGIDWEQVKASDIAVTIKGLSFDKDSGRLTKFECDDAMNATAQLRDMLGFKAAEKPQRLRLEGPGGGPVEVVPGLADRLRAARERRRTDGA